MVWLSFTMYLILGHEKVYKYFGGGYHHPQKRNPRKDDQSPQFFLLLSILLHSTPQVPVEASMSKDANCLL